MTTQTEDEVRFWAEAWNTMADLRTLAAELLPVLAAVQVDGESADRRLAAVLKTQRDTGVAVAVAIREGLAGIAEAQERGLAVIAEQLARMVVSSE